MTCFWKILKLYMFGSRKILSIKKVKENDFLFLIV